MTFSVFMIPRGRPSVKVHFCNTKRRSSVKTEAGFHESPAMALSGVFRFIGLVGFVDGDDENVEEQRKTNYGPYGMPDDDQGEHPNKETDHRHNADAQNSHRTPKFRFLSRRTLTPRIEQSVSQRGVTRTST